jgi:drug/metabolite transporter (DMT)-like permease
MAQTKRKRRTKHRGNAAGVIESRGRTGRRPTEEELRKSSRESARERRMNKPPSWNSAFLKAALMAGLLFVFTRIGLFGDEVPVSQSLVLCAFALLLYTPLAYVTDRWVYQRAQRRKQQQKSG